MEKFLSVLGAVAVMALAGCQACGPKVVSQPPPGALILSPQPAAPPAFFPPPQAFPPQQTVPQPYAVPRPAPAATGNQLQQLPPPRSTGFAPATPQSEDKPVKKTTPYAPERIA